MTGTDDDGGATGGDSTGSDRPETAREDPPEWAKERAREIVETADDGDGPADGSADDGRDEPADASAAADAHGDGAEDRVPDVPVEVVDEAERLTRLARETENAAEAERYRERRDELVTRYGYTPRLREADDTLVLYPDEWTESGTVRMDRVDDTDRAVEVSLSGPGDADRYREIAAYNDAVVDAVTERHGDVHAANARRFATFMSNHYVRPVGDATPEMRSEFREEYFRRNAWPTDDERAALEESLSVVGSVAAALDRPEP